jgi:pimeloyl-ACP methyl ester carboxylesterase
VSDLDPTSGSFEASAGHTIAWRRWDTPDPKFRLFFVHATGFCKEMWLPVVEDLAARGLSFSATAIDQMGHGASTRNWDVPVDWWQNGRDQVQVAGGVPFDMVIGHSSGAGNAVLAALIDLDFTRRMLLIEPIVLPPPYVQDTEHPLVVGALRRKRRFESREAAYANFHGRGAFSGWDERVFEAYIDHGFVAEPDGSVVIACAPEHESEFFGSATAHGGWERMAQVAAPIHIVAGEKSDSHTPEFVELQRARFGATSEIIAGVGHLVPMEAPGIVADVVIQQLGAVTSR